MTNMSKIRRRHLLQIAVGLISAKFIFSKNYFITITKITAPSDILQTQFCNHQSLYWTKLHALMNQSQIIKRVSYSDDFQSKITTVTFWKDKEAYQKHYTEFDKHFKSLGPNVHIDSKTLT